METKQCVSDELTMSLRRDAAGRPAADEAKIHRRACRRGHPDCVTCVRMRKARVAYTPTAHRPTPSVPK